jgi:signal transduction histidine kinase
MLVAVCIADQPRERRERVRIERLTPTRSALMDMNLMRLALRNLLSNALKYSPGSAPVTLRLLDTEEPLALVVEVEDAGAGFPPELWGRLFERGVRAGQAAEGTHGLGLYIVKRVMDVHGGRVELVATGPRGSLLRLHLPQA